MPLNLLDVFQFFQLFFIFKIILLLVLGLYVVFTLVIFNQVKVMGRIIDLESSSPYLDALALIHVLWALSLFVATLVIL